jgi:hypothetical protein
MFIEDLNIQQVAEPIKKLCRLSDIATNQGTGKEFVDFIKYNFARYEAKVLPDALESWMAGRYPEVRPVKTLTIPFLTTILNKYIEDNRHRIKLKPAKMLQAPQKQEDKFDKDAYLTKNVKTALQILNGEYHNYIYVSSFSYCAELLQLKNNNDNELMEMIGLIENHNQALNVKTQANLGENKFRQFAKAVDNRGSLIKASLFLVYVKRNNKIEN